MKFFIFLLMLSSLWGFESDVSKLRNYQPIDVDFILNKNVFKAIRSWRDEGQTYFLVLNQKTLITHITKTLPLPQKMKNSPFSTYKAQLLSLPYQRHNFGITKPLNDKLFLTMDMCPSKKIGYEKELFTFIKQSRSVANIAITGQWMLKHKKDFDELAMSGLQIRWINHSFSHYYDRKEKDWSKNFMLKNPKEFDYEVLETEKLLIINHQVPSIFFRFPGLVSSKELTDKLIQKFSLLPLGTNNWLNVSKKKITNGEIILLHGNLNEHNGIVRFFNQRQEDKRFSAIEEIL